MLLCGLDQVEQGMVVAASVFHPRKPDFELLRPGVVLDKAMLQRLHRLEITRLWVEHDITADLDNRIATQPSPELFATYQQLRHDFAAMSGRAVSAADMQAYRQMIMDLICEVMSNRHLAGLTERLITGSPSLFTHSANVAYLSLCVGLELQPYIVKLRQRLPGEHARDLTALGMGALLHDIGKITLTPEAGKCHELMRLHPDAPNADILKKYHEHVLIGFDLLKAVRMPASARQIVLNHHQHWDGTGFPDMTRFSGGRHHGPQAGDDIHIFSRIVLAANIFDHLLADAQSSRQPVIAALHNFLYGPWTNWLDPVVLRAVVRKIPPFTVGSLVTLNTGRQAVVVTPNLQQPCRPTVRLLDVDHAAEQNTATPTSIDLKNHPQYDITHVSGHNIEKHLFTLLDEQIPAETNAAGDQSEQTAATRAMTC